MRSVFDAAVAWRGQGLRVALATMVSVQGSSSRRPGSCMAVCENGAIAGSVSAGCIEGAVVRAAQEVLAGGCARLVTFGGSEADDAWDVDLPCGGSAEILLEIANDDMLSLQTDVWLCGDPVVRVVRLGACGTDVPANLHFCLFVENGPERGRAVGGLDRAVAVRALARFDHAAHVSGTCEEAGTVVFEGERYFVQRTVPAPRLVCVGATHIAQVLTELAAAMGYRVAVVDPRATFATPERFPRAERVMADWPQRAFPQLALGADTAVCALSHDEKIDGAALDGALRSAAFYIGCLGRPSTQRDRRDALLELGWTDADLERVHGPIGIWTGGRRPEDIALSALGQIAAARNRTIERLGAASDRRLSQMDEAYVEAYDKREVRA